MDHEDIDSRRMDLHRRVALVLRKEPGLVHDFAERLRSKLAAAPPNSAATESERG
jgi:hypothetical protein